MDTHTHTRTPQIKTLSEARGNGTSMISLIVPPKDQVRSKSTAIDPRAHFPRACVPPLRLNSACASHLCRTHADTDFAREQDAWRRGGHGVEH
jgi:hypothetical protein